jgi:hypothetical protein
MIKSRNEKPCHPEPRRRRGTSQSNNKSRESAFTIHEDRAAQSVTACWHEVIALERFFGALPQPRDDPLFGTSRTKQTH